MKKYFRTLFIFLIYGMIQLIPSNVEAYQNVKMDGIQLKEDFNQDGIYQPFFVKGVGYAPIPIGHFAGSGDGWSADCRYTGPYPLNYPAKRFDTNSPDAAFTCGANGSNFYQDLNALDRDFKLLKAMNANTIRTWGPVTPQLLQKANEYGIKVIAGFWIDHNTDYTFPNTYNSSGTLILGGTRRQAIINDFYNYVNTYKNNPAILMWGLTNENNLHFCNMCTFGTSCNYNAQAQGFYKLVNDMTKAAKSAEGSSYHPTMIVVAELAPSLTNYSAWIPDINILGINSYRGRSFDGWPAGNPNLFDDFQMRFPNKGILITEFGVDAWNTNGYLNNPIKGYEDELSQAEWVSSAWDDIIEHSISKGGPSNGGVVFHYSDVYNKYMKRPAGAGQCDYVSSDWTPSVIIQDHGYTDPAIFGNGVMPDNLENPEWWGIVSTGKNSSFSGLDIMTPRLVYDVLKQKFKDAPPHCWVSTAPTKKKVEERFAMQMTCSQDTERLRMVSGFTNPPIASDVIPYLPSNGYVQNRPAGTTGNWTTPKWAEDFRMVKAGQAMKVTFRGENAGGNETDQNFTIPMAYTPKLAVSKSSGGYYFTLSNGIPAQGCNDTQVWIRFQKTDGTWQAYQAWQGSKTDASGNASSNKYVLTGMKSAQVKMQSKDGSCGTTNRRNIISNTVALP